MDTVNPGYQILIYVTKMNKIFRLEFFLEICVLQWMESMDIN